MTFNPMLLAAGEWLNFILPLVFLLYAVIQLLASKGAATKAGPQPRSLSKSRRSTPNFRCLNNPMVWQRHRQSHMKGGTPDDHE